MILPASLLKHARRGATTAALFSTQRGGASLKQTGKDAWLVWSPGVPARIAASYVFVAVALAVLYRSPAAHVGERAAAAAQEALLRGAHRAGWWTLLSLLSSSCCVIQLALNMLSVGCAGFNSVLGPARSFFLACALHARVLLRRTAVGALGVDPRVRQLNVYGGAFAVRHGVRARSSGARRDVTAAKRHFAGGLILVDPRPTDDGLRSLRRLGKPRDPRRRRRGGRARHRRRGNRVCERGCGESARRDVGINM